MKNDNAFEGMLVLARFIHLDDRYDQISIRQLHAKRPIGGSLLASSPWVATQMWTTGDLPPIIPSFSDDGTGIYTDLQGAKRIPSSTLELDYGSIHGRIHL